MAIIISYAQDPKGYMKLWRAKNRHQCSNYHSGWRARNLRLARELDRKHREKRTGHWHGDIINGGLKCSIWAKAEQLTPDILKQEGFEEVFYLSEFGKHSCVDFSAKLNGVVCAIEVTTGDQKRLNPQGMDLIRYLGLQYYVLFVKPDMSGFCLKQVPLSVKRPKLTMYEINHPTPIVHD